METPRGSPQPAGPASPLQQGLSSPPGQKAVPVPYLYDERGSTLYEKITMLQEYTPYRDELNLLEAHLGEIVAELAPGTVLVELGCGDGSKTVTLLRALLERDGRGGVTYAGIDCSAEALQQMQRTLQSTLPALSMDSVALIEAEYAEGVRLARERFPDAPLAILFLGSSIGNFAHAGAVQLLRQLREVAGERVVLMLGCDLMKAADTLHAAYCDSAGVTEAFIKNGMRHALRSVGHPLAEQDVWEYEVSVNAEEEQVEMYLVAKESVPDVFPDVTIERGERVLMEISRKFTSGGLRALAFEAGYCHQATWDSSGRYSLQLLLSPLEALERSWADTDRLFACIQDWTAQPIGLRHPFLFYYGHVAAFAKLRLQPGAVQSELDLSLSRGMDPQVTDPSVCHAHPQPPAKGWPSREKLLDYAGKTRTKLRAAVMEKGFDLSTLYMMLEHERMHQETLCYMVAQQRRADWIAGRVDSTVRVDEAQAASCCFYLDRCSYAEASLEDNTSDDAYGRVPGAKVSLGTSTAGCFVWDNELGCLDHSVGDLLVASHPITVQDFCAFLKEEPYANPKLWSKEAYAHFQAEGVSAPATWSRTADGEYWLHMPEKTYHWQEVADCPVYCSLAEAEAYAARFGARLMTESEYQNAMEQAGGSGIQQLQGGGWEWTSTVFEPFPGFAADPRYPEYSADFFDGLHYVLKGASAYTHPSLRRSSFRNFYQALYRPVFASFRLVRDVPALS